MGYLGKFIFFIGITCFIILSSCGAKKKEEELIPEEPGVSPQPSTSSTPSPSPNSTDVVANELSARLFVASNTTRTIAMYKLDGTFLDFIDLTSTGSGFVTGMTWLDKSNLLAFFDTGASGERILKITFSGDMDYSINANWYSDTTNLSNVTVFNLSSKGFASSPTVLVSRNAVGLEAIYTNTNYTFGARSGSPYIATVANCPITTISYATRSHSLSRIILSSTGANARINTYNASNACPNATQSYNYTTSYPAAAAYSPVGIVSTSNQIFIRYYHATTPVIAACQFDASVAGTTTAPITGCAAFVSDVGMLGVAAGNKELVYEASGNSLFFPNWDSGAIMQTNAATGYTAPLIRDVFTQNVNSISVRPLN